MTRGRPEISRRSYSFRTMGVEEQRQRDAVIYAMLLDGHGYGRVGETFNLSRHRINQMARQMARRHLGWHTSGIGIGRSCPYPIHYYPMGAEGQP